MGKTVRETIKDLVKKQSAEFYEDRFEQGYLEEWSIEKKRKLFEKKYKLTECLTHKIATFITKIFMVMKKKQIYQLAGQLIFISIITISF